jgi:hypothetical protein
VRQVWSRLWSLQVQNGFVQVAKLTLGWTLSGGARPGVRL